MSNDIKNNSVISNNEILNKCWILDYKPTFNNLILPKSYYSKIINLIKEDKTIPMNIMLIGLSGCGKFMFLKCILNYCYGINITSFKQHSLIQHIYFYESIYLIDFMFIKKASFKCIFEFIKGINKRTFIQFNSIPKIMII